MEYFTEYKYYTLVTPPKSDSTLLEINNFIRELRFRGITIRFRGITTEASEDSITYYNGPWHLTTKKGTSFLIDKQTGDLILAVGNWKTVTLGLIIWLLGWCPEHGFFMYPYTYRRNTTYMKKSLNYTKGCHKCQKESIVNWTDQWSDLRQYGPGFVTVNRKKWLRTFLNVLNKIVTK